MGHLGLSRGYVWTIGAHCTAGALGINESTALQAAADRRTGGCHADQVGFLISRSLKKSVSDVSAAQLDRDERLRLGLFVFAILIRISPLAVLPKTHVHGASSRAPSPRVLVGAFWKTM